MRKGRDIIGQETHEVARKILAILRVLADSPEPLGGRVVAYRLGDLGIDLGERAVRYHLKLMDERGLTRSVGRKDGRLITPKGIEELKNALVIDRVGSIADRIELLTYRTSLDLEKRTGEVPINTSLFPREKFDQALKIMEGAFSAGLCVSDLVHAAFEGEKLGEVTVPQGMVGLATVSSIAIGGIFLKTGIPSDSRFGGIFQIRDNKPLRFIELIEYSGCSVDPCQLFIAGKMTSIGETVSRGEGKILAAFRELPAPCRPAAEATIEKLKRAGFGGLVMLGEMSEPICEMPVKLNKIGMILLSGLNPVAAAVEAGIEVTNHAMSGMLDFNKLKRFWDI